MSENKKEGDNGQLAVKVAKLETIVQFHTDEIKEIKLKLDEITKKIDDLKESMTGAKWVVERVIVPLLVTVLTLLVTHLLRL
jgi:chromosome segregation ATPase